jgi:hypothetical protein
MMAAGPHETLGHNGSCATRQIVIGSTIFFGIIIATVTSYFMRPMQSPVSQIVDTIEYNLEHLTDLSIDELELLKQTTDALIVHTERLKGARPRSDGLSPQTSQRGQGGAIEYSATPWPRSPVSSTSKSKKGS